jgi:thiamine-phosphate pyrophosphorylase
VSANAALEPDSRLTARPTLILITDSERFGWPVTERVARALCDSMPPGALAILHREPAASTRTLLEQAGHLRRWTKETGQWLFVRDRWDVALWADADGVHLGEHSASASEVRLALSHFGPPASPSRYISRAWHAVEETPDPHAQLLVVSPVAVTRKGLPALRSAGLARAVVTAKGRAVYALGGIEAEDVGWIKTCGAAGIAVIGSAYADPMKLVAACNVFES